MGQYVDTAMSWASPATLWRVCTQIIRIRYTTMRQVNWRGEKRVDRAYQRHHRHKRGGLAGPRRRRSPRSLPGALSPASGTHLPGWELAGAPLPRRRGRDATGARAMEDARY